MVLWLEFRVRATSFWDSPPGRRPITIFGVAGSNLGMTAYQLNNKNQASNFTEFSLQYMGYSFFRGAVLMWQRAKSNEQAFKI